MKPYDVIKREEIFTGKVVHVVRDTIMLPNGKEAFRELVLHNGAAAVLPVCDNGDFLLVKQHRHAAGDFVLEIPAGKLEKGEDPFTCAKRELEEETGFRSDDITPLTSFYTAIGFSDEMIHIYVAKNLIESKQNLDEDEFVTIERCSAEVVKKMIVNNQIKDSKTIAAVMLYLAIC